MKRLSAALCLVTGVFLFSSAVAQDIEFDPYGFVRAESYYDTESVVSGDWLIYSKADNTPGRDLGQFSVSARHSRIGVKISGLQLGDQVDVIGKLEADFAGGFPNSSTAARQPLLRLRIATISFKTQHWEVRFGQDWVLLSFPYPNTANFVIGAGSGNMWMRMPQLRVAYTGGPVTLTGSVNRPLAGNAKYDSFNSSDLDVNSDGEETGLPFLMGRIDYERKAIGIGVFGHVGWEDIDDLAGLTHRKMGWSVNGAVRLESKAFRIRAKVFQGENLNSFFGGILQGYVQQQNAVENIASMGGWADLTLFLSEKWSCAAGAGMDDPDDEFLGAANRDLNEFMFGNISFKPVKRLTFTFETNYIQTTYVDESKGDNIRFQVLSVFTF